MTPPESASGHGGLTRAAQHPAQPADFLFGLFWAVLGASIAWGSWTMDRLERQGVEPYAVPGLVPGLLGLILLGFGVILALRGWHRAETQQHDQHAVDAVRDTAQQPAGRTQPRGHPCGAS